MFSFLHRVVVLTSDRMKGVTGLSTNEPNPNRSFVVNLFKSLANISASPATRSYKQHHKYDFIYFYEKKYCFEDSNAK